MNFTIIYGSVRSERQGIKAVNFIKNQVMQRGHDVSIIDPVEYELPFLDKMYKEYQKGEAPENMEKIAEIFRNSDGFIFVTAEYNHSIPSVLKNMIDHFMNEYFWKPAAIVCYSAGNFGGVRAAVNLRVILGEVGLVSIPSIFPISKIGDSFDEVGTDLSGKYSRRIKKFLDEFFWYSNTLKEGRKKGTPYS